MNGLRISPSLAGAALALAGLLALACAEPEPAPPPEAWLVGRRAALTELLDRLATLTSTPLGEAATRQRARAPECPIWSARANPGDARALADSLGCASETERRLAVEDDVAFAWPLADGGSVRGRLRVQGGDVHARLWLPERLADGAGGLLLPGTDAAGPGVLALDDTLAHVRVRPASGVDVARFVPQSGQASQMFRLKSALFAGAVLDGTWEGAVYAPRPTEGLPPTALAVGFTARAPAVAAMEQFLADLRETWQIARRPFAVAGAEGACLPELRIMPEFAPCDVATERALVIGWNPASVTRALAAGTARTSTGGLQVALDRFPDADAHFARLEAVQDVTELPRLPWGALRADGFAADDGIGVQISLTAEPGA